MTDRDLQPAPAPQPLEYQTPAPPKPHQLLKRLVDTFILLIFLALMIGALWFLFVGVRMLFSPV